MLGRFCELIVHPFQYFAAICFSRLKVNYFIPCSAKWFGVFSGFKISQTLFHTIL